MDKYADIKRDILFLKGLFYAAPCTVDHTSHCQFSYLFTPIFTTWNFAIIVLMMTAVSNNVNTDNSAYESHRGRRTNDHQFRVKLPLWLTLKSHRAKIAGTKANALLW